MRSKNPGSKAQDSEKLFSFNWPSVISILIPLGSTLLLAINLQEMKALPQLTGNITTLTIALIAVFTLLNIVFTYLSFGDMTLAILGLVIVNLIALALWYKHSVFFYWVGMNLSPVTWIVYRVWL